MKLKDIMNLIEKGTVFYVYDKFCNDVDDYKEYLEEDVKSISATEWAAIEIHLDLELVKTTKVEKNKIVESLENIVDIIMKHPNEAKEWLEQQKNREQAEETKE